MHEGLQCLVGCQCPPSKEAIQREYNIPSAPSVVSVTAALEGLVQGQGPMAVAQHGIGLSDAPGGGPWHGPRMEDRGSSGNGSAQRDLVEISKHGRLAAQAPSCSRCVTTYSGPADAYGGGMRRRQTGAWGARRSLSLQEELGAAQVVPQHSQVP